VSYAHYVLAVLFLVQLFNLADRQILSLVVEDVKAELDVSDKAMGLLGGLPFAAFYVLAGFPIARWADHGVRRSILALGIAVWSLMTVVSGLARSFVTLALARTGVGIGEAAGTPCTHSLVSDYFPQDRRARAFAIIVMGSSAGVAVGNLVGGFAQELWGWRSAFWLLGLPGLAVAALVRWTVREPERGAFDAPGVDTRAESVRDVIAYLSRLPSYRHLVMAAAIHFLAHLGAGLWVPSFLRRVHELDGSEVGVGLAWAMSLPSLLGTFLGGWLADRLWTRDERWLMWLPAISTLVSLPFWALFLLWPSDAALFFAAPYYFASALWSAPLQATAQALVKPRMRALSAAIISFATTLLAMSLGPLAVGAMSDALEPRYGAHAIRYSLLALAGVNFWAFVHNMLGARTLRADLRAKQIA
jgi:predicted MFS family arabinose efflux permease